MAIARFSAGLKMPEDRAALFVPGARCDLRGDDKADSAITVFAFLAVSHDHLAITRFRAFRHDDDRGFISTIGAQLERGANLVVFERNFGDQNDVRAAGNPPMQRDPPGVASHYFQNHDALMTGRGRVQRIDRIHYGCDRGIKTESHRRRFEVVVDRFGNADAIDAALLQLKGCCHRPVAADDNESVDSEGLQHLARVSDNAGRDVSAIAAPDLDDEMSAISRADDRSATRHDAGGVASPKNLVIARRQQTFEAVEETDYFPA